jgi:FixJ family two-component response regulator
LPDVFPAQRGEAGEKPQSAGLHARYQLLPRERKVMRLVVKGLLNKQVAGELGTSQI